MPQDAKLGLIVGLGAVIAVAVVFFQKEVETELAADKKAAEKAIQAAESTSATPTSLTSTGAPAP